MAMIHRVRKFITSNNHGFLQLYKHSMCGVNINIKNSKPLAQNSELSHQASAFGLGINQHRVMTSGELTRRHMRDAPHFKK